MGHSTVLRHSSCGVTSLLIPPRNLASVSQRWLGHVYSRGFARRARRVGHYGSLWPVYIAMIILQPRCIYRYDYIIDWPTRNVVRTSAERRRRGFHPNNLHSDARKRVIHARDMSSFSVPRTCACVRTGAHFARISNTRAIVRHNRRVTPGGFCFFPLNLRAVKRDSSTAREHLSALK